MPSPPTLLPPSSSGKDSGEPQLESSGLSELPPLPPLPPLYMFTNETPQISFFYESGHKMTKWSGWSTNLKKNTFCTKAAGDKIDWQGDYICQIYSEYRSRRSAGCSHQQTDCNKGNNALPTNKAKEKKRTKWQICMIDNLRTFHQLLYHHS